ncbi:class A beta-lactamase [Thalassospira sp.]|uniref:class A beta-lactamase n=1 Tax=Thalassospira sp. TaxID=1912094 RepID=UPI003524DB5A
MIAFHRPVSGLISVSLIAIALLAMPRTALAQDPLMVTVQNIEKRLGARLGLAVYDEQTGRNWQYQADDRFPLTSTFKVLACAAVLARVDQGDETLDRKIVFEESDLVTYSPVTENHTGGDGMSIAELCDATMRTSDNSAANLILDSLSGPEGLTQFLRSVGDDVTRLDRRETGLNEATPGDLRDTTTPNAMVANLRKLVLGDVLAPASRQQLEDWLVGNQVGGPLLRAGLPADWKIGDRTGAGGFGSRNIVAVIWPPHCSPAIVALYITGTEATMAERNAAIAEIGTALETTLCRP